LILYDALWVLVEGYGTVLEVSYRALDCAP
jgi:hypothetical protein